MEGTDLFSTYAYNDLHVFCVLLSLCVPVAVFVCMLYISVSVCLSVSV